MTVSAPLRQYFPDGVFSSGCPSRVVLDHVTSKWGTLVILALAEGEALRWSELRRRAEGVSEKMLAQTLPSRPTVSCTATHVRSCHRTSSTP